MNVSNSTLEAYYSELRQLEDDYDDDRVSYAEYRLMKRRLDQWLAGEQMEGEADVQPKP